MTTVSDDRATEHPAVRTRAPMAGALLSFAGMAILMGIMTAEALYPAAYRTSANTISDLGGTRPPNSVVLQPSAAIFDTTMIVTGLLIMAGAYVGRQALGRAVAVLTCLLGVGVTGVGVFPGNTGTHPLFAMLAFTAGGLAALLSFRCLHGSYRYLAALLGVTALGGLVVATFWIDWTPVAELGEGGIERWIAYPIVLWLVSLGGYLQGIAQRNGEISPERKTT
jgi:hypothetical membrane protein